MRRVMRIQLLYHIIFFLVAFTLIGFKTVLSELIWALWTYSMVLTLREAMIVIYWFSMLLGFLFKIYELAEYDNYRLLA